MDNLMFSRLLSLSFHLLSIINYWWKCWIITNLVYKIGYCNQRDKTTLIVMLISSKVLSPCIKEYLSCDLTKPTKWVCAQQRLRSAWASAQTDLSLSWALTHFVGLVMLWLIYEHLAINYMHTESLILFLFFLRFFYFILFFYFFLQLVQIISASRLQRDTAIAKFVFSLNMVKTGLEKSTAQLTMASTPISGTDKVDICGMSSEFVSSSIPSWQIFTAHAQPFRGARDLAFCLKVPFDSLLVWAKSGGSSETVQMCRLAWIFAACIGDKYQIYLMRPIWW